MPPSTTNSAFCGRCGRRNMGNSAFCGSCGADLRVQPSPLTQAPPRPQPVAPRRVAIPDPVAPLMPHAPHRHHYYRLVLAVGIVLLILLSIAAANSGSPLAVGVLVVLGSFFVPVVYVLYMEEIDALGGVPPLLVVGIGALTVVIAIPSALILSTIVHAGAGGLIPSLLTGLVEEAAKIGVLLVFVHFTRYRFELDGVIFGAAAGMAFAGVEDALYGLSSLAQYGISSFITTLWIRQILGPFGHGTWTAAIAAVIWRERFAGPGRLDRRVLVAYLISSGLHGLWDYSPVAGFADYGWMLIVGIVSVIVLRQRIREALGQERRALGVS